MEGLHREKVFEFFEFRQLISCIIRKECLQAGTTAVVNSQGKVVWQFDQPSNFIKQSKGSIRHCFCVLIFQTSKGLGRQELACAAISKSPNQYLFVIYDLIK